MRVGRLSNVFPVRIDASGFRWGRACAGLVFLAACTGFAQDGHPAAAASATSGAPQAPVTAVGDAKPQAGSPATPLKQQKASDDERKKQISDESTQLLAMALALKAEVDKTNKDTLSLSVIRKADAIERLAKTVKDKTK